MTYDALDTRGQGLLKNLGRGLYIYIHQLCQSRPQNIPHRNVVIFTLNPTPLDIYLKMVGVLCKLLIFKLQ